MKNIRIMDTAALDFERFDDAVMWGVRKARISRDSVFRKAKVAPHKFRLAGQFNRIPTNSGFFTSIAAGDTDRISLYQASPDQMEPLPLTYQTRNRTVTMSRVLRGYISSTSQMSDAQAERGRQYVAHSKRVIPLFVQCVKHKRNNCPNLVSRVKQFTQSTNFPYWVVG